MPSWPPSPPTDHSHPLSLSPISISISISISPPRRCCARHGGAYQSRMVSDHSRLMPCQMGCRHRLRSIRLLFCDRGGAIGVAEHARSAARASPGRLLAIAPPTPRLPASRHFQLLRSSASCPAGWAAAIASDPSGFSSATGVALSEPRSVRADSIPGSERHDSHCRASAGRGSVPRRPGAGESHHHSAELRSMRDQPPAQARATDRHMALSHSIATPSDPPPITLMAPIIPILR